MLQKKLTYRDKVKRFTLRMTDNRCAYCGNRFENGEILHLDHVIPLHGIGSSTRRNFRGYENQLIVPSCVRCNLSKGNKTLDEYREIIRIKKNDPNFYFLIDQIELHPVTHDAINDPEVINYGKR